MKRPQGIDKAVINLLQNSESDLEQKKPVSFYLYFPAEHYAYEVAATLSNLQFEVSVTYSEYSENWLCLANKQMVVTTERLTDLGDWLEEISEQYEGNYDGWETVMTPPDEFQLE